MDNERGRSSRRPIAGERRRTPSADTADSATLGGARGHRAAYESEVEISGVDKDGWRAAREDESPVARRDESSAEQRSPWQPPLWLLAVVAALLALTVAADTWLVARHTAERREAAELENTLSRAPAVAENAAAAVLSYQWDKLEKNTTAAQKFLSQSYRSEYTSSMRNLVSGAARDTRAKVEAQVRSAGVMAASGDRCEVLLFVNQTTKSTANDGEPRTALNRVIFTMVKNDGRWLVNEIKAL